MPVQQTFTLIPEAGGHAATSNNAPIRPMTSKQIKKARKEANKQPKLSRAEQRRLELAEQERIRKELEKERQSSKAKAARQRKKDKEQAQLEARRKNGRPLVDVRPSQDTISRFVRGNGSGRKRDGGGVAVHTGTDDVPVTDAGPSTDQRAEKRQAEALQTILEDDGLITDSEQDGLSVITKNNPSPPKENPSFVVEDGTIPGGQDHTESLHMQQDANTRISSWPFLEDDLDELLPQRPASKSRPHNRSNLKSQESCSIPPILSRLANDVTLDLIKEERFAKNNPAESDSVMVEMPQTSESIIGQRRPDGRMAQKGTQSSQSSRLRLSGRSNKPASQMLDFMGNTQEFPIESFDSMLPIQKEPFSPFTTEPKRPSKTSTQDRKASGGSFRLDSDDLIDDELLIELDNNIQHKVLLVEETELQRQHQSSQEKTPSSGNAQQDWSRALEGSPNHNVPRKMSCTPVKLGSKYSSSKEPAFQPSKQPGSATLGLKASQPNGTQIRKGLQRAVSFLEEDLDDAILVDLVVSVETGNSMSKRPTLKKQSNQAEYIDTRPNGRSMQSASYEKDLGLLHSPQRQTPPLSTQAILFNFDDFFPSSSQQARELEDDNDSTFLEKLPLNEAPRLPLSGPETRCVGSSPQLNSPPQQQKRFFTASGFNGTMMLALHRSRKTAALEQLHRKEQQRVEAGILEQQMYISMHQQQQPQRSETRPQKALKNNNEQQLKATAQVSSKTGQLQSSSSISNQSRTVDNSGRTMPVKPSRTNGNTQTIKLSEKTTTAVKQGQKHTSATTTILDKENIPPRQTHQPSQSQETEYGGDWIEELGMDLIL